MKQTLIVLTGTFPEIQLILSKFGKMTLGELATLEAENERK